MDPTVEDDCPVCRQLRPECSDEHVFVVAPADGGGWEMWAASLLRLFQRIGSQPTQAVVITQDSATQRYAQVLIGHGLAHAEAASNVYLTGDSRLDADHEDLLGRLGWLPPEAEFDDPDEMPANWSLPLVHGDWAYLVEVMVATVVGVFGFDADAPVEVRCFTAAHPCRDCSWGDGGVCPPS